MLLTGLLFSLKLFSAINNTIKRHLRFWRWSLSNCLVHRTASNWITLSHHFGTGFKPSIMCFLRSSMFGRPSVYVTVLLGVRIPCWWRRFLLFLATSIYVRQIILVFSVSVIQQICHNLSVIMQIHRGRAVRDMHHLRRHRRWRRGIEFHLRNGCLCVFTLCLCCPLRRQWQWNGLIRGGSSPTENRMEREHRPTPNAHQRVLEP
jgi:hypothetical protein